MPIAAMTANSVTFLSTGRSPQTLTRKVNERLNSNSQLHNGCGGQAHNMVTSKNGAVSGALSSDWIL